MSALKELVNIAAKVAADGAIKGKGLLTDSEAAEWMPVSKTGFILSG